STLDAVKPSCCNEKGSNERPSNIDDCDTREKQPNLKRQPSQNLVSRKPQDCRKAYEDGQSGSRSVPSRRTCALRRMRKGMHASERKKGLASWGCQFIGQSEKVRTSVASGAMVASELQLLRRGSQRSRGYAQRLLTRYCGRRFW